MKPIVKRILDGFFGVDPANLLRPGGVEQIALGKSNQIANIICIDWPRWPQKSNITYSIIFPGQRTAWIVDSEQFASGCINVPPVDCKITNKGELFVGDRKLLWIKGNKTAAQGLEDLRKTKVCK